MEGYYGCQEVWELEEAPLTASTGAAGGSSSGVIRIWLVDDSDNFRVLLGSLLNDERGFKVSRQFDSPEGVLKALACETAPDVILLDIQMGPYNGLDAIQPIRALAPNTHVLMLTTLGERESRERAFRDGASDFMLKSWDMSKIVLHIRRAMELGAAAGLVTAFLSGTRSSALPQRAVNVGEQPGRSGRIVRGILYLRDLFHLSHAG